MMSEVGQVGASGFDIESDFDGLGGGEMSGMGAVTEAINNEDAHPLNLLADLCRHGGTIAQVGKETLFPPREQIAEGRHFSMRDRQGDERKGAKREGTLHRVGSGSNIRGDVLVGIKSVGEHFFERGESCRGAIDGDSISGHLAEPSQVIEPGDMVGMGVGENDRVGAGDLLADTLQPQLRRGIDDKRAEPVIDVNRAAGTGVAGVGGSADRAGTSEKRNALRGA